MIGATHARCLTGVPTPMADYAATAKKYSDLAARATDPAVAEAYRNLAEGYRLLARGTELLNQSGRDQEEA